MGEQLDGIRLLWDGSGQLFLRSGKEVPHVPEFIKSSLPEHVTVEIELTYYIPFMLPL